MTHPIDNKSSIFPKIFDLPKKTRPSAAPLALQAICEHWLVYVKALEEKSRLRGAVTRFIRGLFSNAEVMGRVFLVLLCAKDEYLLCKIVKDFEQYTRPPAGSLENIKLVTKILVYMRQGWVSEGYPPRVDFSDVVFRNLYSRLVSDFAQKLGLLPGLVIQLLEEKLQYLGCGCKKCNSVVLAELRAWNVGPWH